MHKHLQSFRGTFYANNETFVLPDAPIGWDDLKLDLTRSKKTDGIVLDIMQDNKFTGLAMEKLIYFREKLGADGKVLYKIEYKISDNWETFVKTYIELSSIKIDNITAAVDFVDNDFDATFRANQKERFEIDRLTDIEGNTIEPLTTSVYKHTSREIFLRSDLNHKPLLLENLVTDVTIVPLLEANPVSDDDVFPVINVPAYETDPLGDGSISVASVFHFDASRDKVVTLYVNIDISVTNYSLAQLHIYKYENGENLEYKERIQLGSNFVTDGADVIYNGIIQVEILEGESLMLGMFVNSGTYTVEVNSVSIRQKENSLFEPKNIEDRNIDCITIHQGFSRLFKILSPTVDFRSDYIEKFWNDVVIFSGETLRHVEYNGKKASLGTFSFEDLFKAAFTIMGGIAFNIQKSGTRVQFRIEETGFFFDDGLTIDLGVLSDITIEDNLDKIFTGVEVGYKKSGDNEEVFGLQATHTVNRWNLPVNTKENIYDATCDFRADPNEEELAWRKQFSQFPETDTRYDKDMFVVDCYQSGGFYLPFEWATHFSSVSGIFSPDTAWNYRLSPVNCLIRHAENFKQEFGSSYYNDKNIVFQNTQGNAALKTTVIGGVEREEDGTIPLSELPRALYGNKIVKGKAVTSYDKIKEIREVLEKPNYYGKFNYVDQKGQSQSGFMAKISADDKLEVELYK